MLSRTLNTFEAGSRLPLEIYETVIDLVADEDFYPGAHRTSRRSNLSACCLVCRTFVPRCRIHLYKEIILRSRTQLALVVQTLSRSQILSTRVRHLTIDATNTADQSWISTIPRLLPLSLFSLVELSLRGVDLSLVHSTFFPFFICFSRCIEDSFITLNDVRFKSHTQLAPLFNIARSAKIYYGSEADCAMVASLGRLPPPPKPGVQRDRVTGISPRFFELSVTTWEALALITRNLDLSGCVTQEWNIDFHIGRPNFSNPTTEALGYIVRAFERRCWRPPVDARPLTLRLLSGMFSLWLEHYSSGGVDTVFLKLYVDFAAVQVVESVMDVAHVVSCLSSPVYQILEFHISRGKMSHPPIPIAELVEAWKAVDESLSRPTYAHINVFRIWCHKDVDLPEREACGCITDLFKGLLPRFSARVNPVSYTEKCECAYHRRAETQRARNMELLAM